MEETFSEVGQGPYHTIQVCPPSKKNKNGIKCTFCGVVLDCEDCSQRLVCLGKNHWFFCSHNCAQRFEKRFEKMKRLKNYFWEHPFRTIAMAGTWLSTICTFIYVFDQFSFLKSLIISGILLIVSAVASYWVNEVGSS